MKVGRDYAWWVSYSWTYDWFDEESAEWITDKDFEAERLTMATIKNPNCQERLKRQ